MLSEATGDTTTPLLQETIGQNLARIAREMPDGDALVSRHQHIRWSYRDFDERVTSVARGLLAAGLSKGDRVGVWSPNNAQWVLLQYATARVGLILVNINPAYRTHELRYALDQSGCSALFAASGFKTSDYVGMIEEVHPDVPTLEQVFFVDTDGWDEFLDAGESVDTDEVMSIQASLHPDDPINIQYTSGTTGYPKGATLSHSNILNNGFFVGEVCRYTSEDRVCIPVPLYHCFGMVLGNLACTTHGATIVYPGDAFEPDATLETVQEEACTSLYGVPTMFIAMLSEPEFDSYDLSSLRTGIMAGSPCPIEVMRKCVEEMHMSEVTIAYGMTETSPVSTQTHPDDPIEKRVSTVGRVHPHVEIKIIDPESKQTLPRSRPGELCTRGYSVMAGYWSDPDRTSEAIDSDGWMHTGDLATMDEDGYVNIVGRIKDMVIRGGENIYPREIEEFLYSHPRIRDVQVVGVPDSRYGEELLAWVQTEDGEPITVEEIREFCTGRISHFKIPRYVIATDSFPMTVTGKIRKVQLREMGVERLGLSDQISETA